MVPATLSEITGGADFIARVCKLDTQCSQLCSSSFHVKSLHYLISDSSHNSLTPALDLGSTNQWIMESIIPRSWKAYSKRNKRKCNCRMGENQGGAEHQRLAGVGQLIHIQKTQASSALHFTIEERMRMRDASVFAIRSDFPSTANHHNSKVVYLYDSFWRWFWWDQSLNTNNRVEDSCRKLPPFWTGPFLLSLK